MELKSIGFNSLNIIFELFNRCILVKKNQAEKNAKKQVRSVKGAHTLKFIESLQKPII